MTGPEHWKEADLILSEDPCEYGCPHSGCAHEMRQIARAQVHAALALAEAYVAGAVMHPEDRDEWDRATGRLAVGDPPDDGPDPDRPETWAFGEAQEDQADEPEHGPAVDTFTCRTTPMPWPTRDQDRTCPDCGTIWEREPVDIGTGARIKSAGCAETSDGEHCGDWRDGGRSGACGRWRHDDPDSARRNLREYRRFGSGPRAAGH